MKPRIRDAPRRADSRGLLPVPTLDETRRRVAHCAALRRTRDAFDGAAWLIRAGIFKGGDCRHAQPTLETLRVGGTPADSRRDRVARSVSRPSSLTCICDVSIAIVGSCDDSASPMRVVVPRSLRYRAERRTRRRGYPSDAARRVHVGPAKAWRGRERIARGLVRTRPVPVSPVLPRLCMRAADLHAEELPFPLPNARSGGNLGGGLEQRLLDKTATGRAQWNRN